MMAEGQNDFPLEVFYKIENNASVELRLTINLGTGVYPYWVEVDVVDSENKKIITHLGSGTNLENYKDAEHKGLSIFREWRVK